MKSRTKHANIGFKKRLIRLNYLKIKLLGIILRIQLVGITYKNSSLLPT